MNDTKPNRYVRLEVCDCGHPPCFTTADRLQLLKCGYTISTGYAWDPQGRSLCFDCTTEHDRSALRAWRTDDPPILLYLQPVDHNGNRWITNWPGATLMRVTRHSVKRVGFGRMEYVQAVDCYGRQWYGRGSADNGTYTRLRQLHNAPVVPPTSRVFDKWPARPWQSDNSEPKG